MSADAPLLVLLGHAAKALETADGELFSEVLLLHPSEPGFDLVKRDLTGVVRLILLAAIDS